MFDFMNMIRQFPNMLATQNQPQPTNMLANPSQPPQQQPSLADSFLGGNRGQALGDMFAGWAMGATPQQSLGYGAAMLAQGRKDRKVKDRQNQTVEWLKGRGMDESQAKMIASQPTVLTDYLKNMNDPMHQLDMDYKRAQIDALHAKPEGTAEIQNYEYAKKDGYQGSFSDFRTEIKRASSAANIGGTSIDLEGLPMVGLTADGIADKDAQKEFLTHLPPSLASQVPGIAEGRIDINKVTSLRSGERQELAKLVSLYDSSWDMSKNGARVATRKDYATGEMAKLAASTNLAIKHMGGMFDEGGKLNNTWFTPWNAAKNTFGSTTGDPNIKAFETYRLGVADELGKAFHGVGAVPESQKKEWQDAISTSSSPEQLKAAVTSALEMLSARTETYNQRYRNVMGADAPSFLDDTAVKALRKMGIDPAGIDPRYAGAATASNEPASTGGPQQIISEEDYLNLPSGAEFIAPDGKIRRKP